jgi:tetratricopeptide (TPR) repeat protein
MMQYGVKLNESRISERRAVKEKLLMDIIDYCENVNEKFEDSVLTKENKFYYAGVLGYLARSYGLNRSWWSAFQTGQDAESLMDEIIEEDTEFYDAYLMLGMFEYFADRMSGITSFIASILGFSGDRDTGLEYIKLAYEKGSPVTFGQASLMLIEIYTRMEDNPFASLAYFEKFLEKYPGNFRINSWYGRELISTWNYEKARLLIEKDSLGVVDANVKAFYYSGIGDSRNAVKYSKMVLDNSDTHYRWITRGNQVIYVTNNWLLGNYEEAVKYMPELDEHQRKIINDIIEHPEDSKWLADFRSAIARGESPSYMDGFLNDPPEFKRADNNYMRYYYSGIYYFGISDYENAESYFSKAKSSGDSYIGYKSLKYLVEIYINNTSTDTVKVERLIEEIDDLDEESLSFRARELSAVYNLD